MEVQRIHFSEIESTNTWAKDHIDELDASTLTLIRADVQSGGRGRQGRTWISKAGNLHLTIVFSAADTPEKIPNLGQILALTACKILEQTIPSPRIKWPNDLLINGRKCGGILVEMVGQMAILGIGIDVHSPIETDQETIALCQLNDNKWDLDALSTALGAELIRDWKRDFVKVRHEILERMAYIGEKISIRTGARLIEGTLMGLSPRGELQLKLHNGTLLHFSSGDIIQVRKV